MTSLFALADAVFTLGFRRRSVRNPLGKPEKRVNNSTQGSHGIRLLVGGAIMLRLLLRWHHERRRRKADEQHLKEVKWLLKSVFVDQAGVSARPELEPKLTRLDEDIKLRDEGGADQGAESRIDPAHKPLEESVHSDTSSSRSRSKN